MHIMDQEYDWGNNTNFHSVLGALCLHVCRVVLPSIYERTLFIGTVHTYFLYFFHERLISYYIFFNKKHFTHHLSHCLKNEKWPMLTLLIKVVFL